MRKLQKLYRWYVLSMLIMLPTTLLTLWNDKGIMAIPNIIAKFALSPPLQTIPSMSNFSYILNGVGWFLSALLVLYAVYPVLERLNRQLVSTRKLVLSYLFVVFLLRFLCLLFFSFIASNTRFNDLNFASPLLRIFDFTIGILLCDLFFHKTNSALPTERVEKSSATRLETFCILLLIGWWLGRNAMFYGQYEDVKDTFDILLAAALVYVFAFERGKISTLLRSRKLVLLGNVSMYIYLFHFPFPLILGTDLLHLNHNAYQFKLDKCLLVIALELLLTFLLTFFAYKADQRKINNISTL